jgi:hypothetical protein
LKEFFFFFFFFFNFDIKVMDDMLESQCSTDYGMKDFDFRTKNLSLMNFDFLKLFKMFEIILIRFQSGMSCCSFHYLDVVRHQAIWIFY